MTSEEQKTRGYKDLLVWRKGITLETHLLIAMELRYCTEADVHGALGLVAELRRMLNVLLENLSLVTNH